MYYFCFVINSKHSNNMTKPAKKQTSPTEQLRDFIRSSGFELTAISKRSGIEYRRLDYIVKKAGNPTFDEAEKLRSILPVMIREKVEELSTVEQRYAAAPAA